jgi:chemotaxis family two-component system response regulator Rcp1
MTESIRDKQPIGRPMEIFLVEDNLLHSRFMLEVLKQSGIVHRLTMARDGAEAIAFLRREGVFARAPRPDLILLDLILPKINGLSVLSTIKQDSDLRSIPVVVLTASDEVDDRNQCEALGVDGFLHKPVDVRKLVAIIRELRRFWKNDLLIPAID